MPTTGIRPEDKLIDLLLSLYQDRTWAGELSSRFSPEREIDGGVELIATRKSDGRTLAIEHTLIEPFIGERSDFHRHFKEFQRQLRADESLQVPGFAIYMNAPVGVLPHGSDWQGIIDDVGAWVRQNSLTFPAELSEQRCPCPRHPAGELILQVSSAALDDPSAKFLIVQRYGEMRVGDAVEKALRGKLPKLAKAQADKRLLLLERDQAWVDVSGIYDEIERRRPQFRELAVVNEIWIADTASFGDKGRYVCFSCREGGVRTESFAFYDGKLIQRSRNGMPIPVHPERNP